jgi:nickel-dependent lactate racemase
MVPLEMVKIRQALDKTVVGNIASEISNEMSRVRWSSKVSAGARVAIAAGSRGIANIAEITAAIVREVRRAAADPFIVPAMGSHGGATADGQRDILKGYGISEREMGAPVRSSMEVVHIGETESGMPVYIDKIAQEADHIIVVNRIKPHTEFQGQIESGLMKMMVIGLGKHRGATIAHAYAVKFGFEKCTGHAGNRYYRKWVRAAGQARRGTAGKFLRNRKGPTKNSQAQHAENPIR